MAIKFARVWKCVGTAMDGTKYSPTFYSSRKKAERDIHGEITRLGNISYGHDYRGQWVWVSSELVF